MKYNFNEIIQRKNTNSIKYDFAIERGKPENILPLWVADMDFKVADEITEAIVKSANHGIFGYSEVKDEYFNAVRDWFMKGFGFQIEKEWLVKTPGVVFAIATAIRAFTEKGDSILIQRPVYYPFSHMILKNQRKIINNQLVYAEGKYTIDFDDFEKKIIDNNVKLFIFCSPHNPIGRVWTLEELEKISQICLKHNCIILSDEIHCDFVYNRYKHHILGSVSAEILQNCIICTAPSKTFNLAGLQVSNIFIANEDLRAKFIKEIEMVGYSQLNTVGLIACQAAYTHGREWLVQLNEYLTENLSFIRSFLNTKLPEIKLIEPEGTYLVWLDFSSFGLSQEELDELIEHKAGLWLDTGTMFGPEGTGFQRINIACPRSVLEQAFIQLEQVLK